MKLILVLFMATSLVASSSNAKVEEIKVWMDCKADTHHFQLLNDGEFSTYIGLYTNGNSERVRLQCSEILAPRADQMCMECRSQNGDVKVNLYGYEFTGPVNGKLLVKNQEVSKFGCRINEF